MSNLTKYEKTTKKINELADSIKTLSDEELRHKTTEFKERLKNGETLEDIKVEAFAVLKEASARTVGKTPYDVQIMSGLAIHDGCISEQKTGEGKAVVVSTPIPTPSGWKRAGDIKLGDFLFDRHGHPTKVTGVFPQGKKDVFTVKLEDGRFVDCCKDHLWAVYRSSKDKNTATMRTEEIFEALNLQNNSDFYLPLNEYVEYSSKRFNIDPYIFGFLLSNGFKKTSESYPVISDFLNDIPAGLLYDEKNFNGYIPDKYKIASYKQRVSFVRGLFDTNELIYVDKSKQEINIPYITSSERLIDDILELLYSLGFSCSANEIKSGEYLISLHVTDCGEQPLLCLDKSLSESRNDITKVKISSIKKTEREEEQVCFTVDNDEHLFLVGKYIVTHNTLTCAAPAYLNALEGKGVHVVTVNDYLAQRDAEDIGRIHNFLGLTVGCVLAEDPPEKHREAYACDITYVTNSEVGFDYLRDNMVKNVNERVQRGLNFCIIDEADSILIDEARTPLIISGAGKDGGDFYQKCDEAVKRLRKGRVEDDKDYGDYILDEKEKSIRLTETGIKKIEKMFNISNYSDIEHFQIRHGIYAALRANYCMNRNTDYVVKEGKIEIVDEFTGRILPGRRFSDGIHQAIEAKEGVKVEDENPTNATVTYQHFFNKYKKKSGMTGTAATEKKEFKEIYNMRVVEIPTHRPVIRIDEEDRVYLTKSEKYTAVLNETRASYEKGQPVLIGTGSVEDSEFLGSLFKAAGLPVKILNARRHREEAAIIAKAGRSGSITIATNMAGRGTDIILDKKAKEAGGLQVFGTQRFEARRIDNQLRGRSGRQGDPGRSVFFLSLEDDLIKRYASPTVIEAIKKISPDFGKPLQSKSLTKAIRKAQLAIEGQHFSARKNVVDFDTVNDEQRELIYAERNRILECDNFEPILNDMAMYLAQKGFDKYVEDNVLFPKFIFDVFGLTVTAEELPTLESRQKYILDAAKNGYERIHSQFAFESAFNEFAGGVLLNTIDKYWMEHLDNLTKLRDSVSFISYGQKNPVDMYRIEAYQLFEHMLMDIRGSAISVIYRAKVLSTNPVPDNMKRAILAKKGLIQRRKEGKAKKDEQKK